MKINDHQRKDKLAIVLLPVNSSVPEAGDSNRMGVSSMFIRFHSFKSRVTFQNCIIRVIVLVFVR